MRNFLTTAIAATLSAAALSAPGLAAQSGQGQGGQAQMGQAPAEGETFQLTDQHVDAFVEAALQINAYVAEVRPELEAAGSEAERTQIQERAQDHINSIVVETGLSVTEYTSIANAARNDQSVAQRINQAAMEAQAAQTQ